VSRRRLERELKKLAESIGGDEAIAVIKALRGKDYQTDEELAEKTKIRVNTVRKILYALNEIGIAEFKRIKDQETGWYYYYWKLNMEKLPKVIMTKKRKELEKLKKKLEEGEQIYYWCGVPDHPKMTFDEALEYEFQCPICRRILNQYDNSKELEEIRKKIEQLEREIGLKKNKRKRGNDHGGYYK